MDISLNPDGYNLKVDVEYDIENGLPFPYNVSESRTFSISSYKKNSYDKIGFIQFTTLLYNNELLNQKFSIYDVVAKSGIYEKVKRVIITLKDEEGGHNVYFIGKH